MTKNQQNTLPNSWRDRAAAALDATHHLDGRGPKTFAARITAASWLDGVGFRPAAIREAIRWLERLAKAAA